MTRGNVNVNIRSQFDGRGTKEAETAMARLNTTGKKHFGELTKHALGYGAALVGGAGIVGGLEATVEASLAAEKSQASLQAQLKASGISYKDNAKQIDDVVTKTSSLSGFLDRDLKGALTNLVRSTGSLGESYKLLGLSTDVARAKHIDVASAGQMVGRVFAGNVRVLKSLGISMDPVTAAQDKLKASTTKATDAQKAAAKEEDKRATSQKALALLQQRLGGQAKAYGDTTAGSLDKMKAAVDNLEVRLGNALAPTIKTVADHVAKFVAQMQSGTGAGGRFADKMKTVADDVGKVLGVIKDVAGWLGKHPALLAAAGAAWVAYKTAALAQIAIVKAASLGLFGSDMKAKLGKEAEGAGSDIGKGFAAKAGLAAAAGFAGWEIGSWLRKNVGPVRDAGNAVGNAFGSAFFRGANFKQQIDQLANQVAAAENQFLKGLPNAIGNVGAIGGKALGNVTHPGRGKGGPQGTGRTNLGGHRVSTSSVPAHASSVGAGDAPVASAAGSTGSYALANLVASKFGLRISSGYRSPQHNAAIGGAPNSWHTKGTVSNPGAIDLVGSMGAMQAGLAWVQANVPGLAEAMIDNYAGLGWNLHIAGPGLMNWNGGTGSGSGTSAGGAPAASAPAAKAAAPPKVTPYDRLENALTHTGLLGDAGMIGGNAVDQRKLSQIAAALKIKGKGALRGDDRLRALAEARTTRSDLKTRLKSQQITPVKHPNAFPQTLNNPWLQAYLTHQDYLAATGALTQDQADANKVQALQGAIKSGKLPEADVVAAKSTIDSLMPSTGAALSGLDTVNNDLSNIDLHVRAGDESPAQGNQDKIDRINAQLRDTTGWSADDVLQLRAELGDLTQAVKDNTQTVQQQLDLANQQLADQKRIAATMTAQGNTVLKGLSDLISGQIGGYAGFGGRALTAGAGSVVRY